MSSPTILALTAFISWALALLILMEILRTKLVLAKKTVVTSFVPDNSNLSPFDAVGMGASEALHEG